MRTFVIKPIHIPFLPETQNGHVNDFHEGVVQANLHSQKLKFSVATTDCDNILQ